MIQKVEMFTVKCNGCGVTHKDEQMGYCAWNDEQGALECSDDSGWLNNGDDTHYCPDCYYYDDNDNLMIKKVGLP